MWLCEKKKLVLQVWGPEFNPWQHIHKNFLPDYLCLYWVSLLYTNTHYWKITQNVFQSALQLLISYPTWRFPKGNNDDYPLLWETIVGF